MCLQNELMGKAVKGLRIWSKESSHDEGQWCEVQTRLPIRVTESGYDVAQLAVADSKEKSEKTGIMITGGL